MNLPLRLDNIAWIPHVKLETIIARQRVDIGQHVYVCRNDEVGDDYWHLGRIVRISDHTSQVCYEDNGEQQKGIDNGAIWVPLFFNGVLRKPAMPRDVQDKREQVRIPRTVSPAQCPHAQPIVFDDQEQA